MAHRTFHGNFDRQADRFIGDLEVVALCEAIAENGLEEMRRLIVSGAAITANGHDNVTPLLRAFPDNQLKRFELLLEHGADPNIRPAGDLGVPAAFGLGDSATVLAARPQLRGYLDAAPSNDGNPNIEDHSGNSLIYAVIKPGVPDAKQRVSQLIDAGADIFARNSWGRPLTIAAAGWFQQYDVAPQLLNAGVDPSICQKGTRSKLIHAVVGVEDKARLFPPQVQRDHQRLLNRLIELGEDAEAARADVKRWSAPKQVPPWATDEVPDWKVVEPPQPAGEDDGDQPAAATPQGQRPNGENDEHE